MRSFYECGKTSEILRLIKQQPDPEMFYQSFFETDLANFASILASDSLCTQTLLSPDFKGYFSEEFPIIYKLGVTQPDGRVKECSAIDIALANDQAVSVGQLIDYIVEYQNSFVSSFLFAGNLGRLIGMGVNMQKLWCSKVFLREFDYDGWPSVHDADEESLRPYNGSLFDLRDSYRSVFPEEEYLPIDMATAKGKLSKIRYTINLLPQFFFGHVDTGDDDGNLWDELKDDEPTITGQPDEEGNWPPGREKIDYFTAEPIAQIIDFKWENGTSQ